MDPADWQSYRDEMHALLDTCIDHLSDAGARPWQPVPESFAEAIALDGQPGPVTNVLTDDMIPTATGNTHPAFFGWVHGTGQAAGLASELVAAAMNSNCGGRNHGAIAVEREVLRWLCEVAGLPESAGGILTTGTTQATLYALSVARVKRFGAGLRSAGIAGLPPCRVYAAEGVHDCAAKVLQVMGHGDKALKKIPLADGAMDVTALEAQLETDRRAGIEPLAIIGTAGSVKTGTFDDLDRLASLAARYGSWLHVDAAFGFWTRLAEAPWRDLTKGMPRADSIALDGHKWLGVPYECGAVLMPDQAAHRATFAGRADYLEGQSEGLASGEWWPTEYGLDLSRGFRALKMWTTIRAHGSDTIGAVVSDNCRQAALMGELAEASEWLDLAQPVVSNLCVMRPRHGDAGDLATRLQLSGAAVFSTTTIDGASCLRAAIVNHRTDDDVIRAVVAALEAEIEAVA